MVRFTAKAAGYTTLALATGAFVGVYALYSLYIDDKKKQPNGTNFKESLMMNKIKDTTVIKIRSRGIDPFPTYKTKAQLLEEEAEKNRKIEEDRKTKLKILRLRREIEDIVTSSFDGSGDKKDAEEIMDDLKKIGKSLSKIDSTYRSMETLSLIHKTYRKKYNGES